MTRRPQSRGTCAYCGKEYSKSGMTRHLKTCEARQEAIARASKKRGRDTTIYHLQILDNTPPYTPFHETWLPNFWLHLEMKGNATLKDLDEYLRAIWLECCGHLSGFEIGPVFYTQLFDDGMGWREERSMNVRVDKLFRPGMIIPYQYDFGTTSEVLIKVLDARQGKPITSHPIELMARNNMPEVACHICGKPATWLDSENIWSGEEPYLLCEEHADEHENEEMLMPLVNSPRTGLCGYFGPAEPPY